MIPAVNRLHRHIAQLISDIKRRHPEVQIEVSYEPYETEDADLILRCPPGWQPDQYDELSEWTATLTSDLLLRAGVSVPILVLEPEPA